MMTSMVLFLALLFHIIIPSHTFASWFMAACLTDLWDPDEIIMGHYVVPYDKGTHGDQIFLQAFDQNKEEIGNGIGIDVGNNVINLNTIDYDENDDGSITYRFLIKLKVESTNEFNGLQYVFDAKVSMGADNSHENIDNNNDTLTAQFPSYNNGCDGRRIYGTTNDDSSSSEAFHITISKSMRDALTSNGGTAVVKVVAGWASEREAVKLTKALVFVFSGGDMDDKRFNEL